MQESSYLMPEYRSSTEGVHSVLGICSANVAEAPFFTRPQSGQEANLKA